MLVSNLSNIRINPTEKAAEFERHVRRQITLACDRISETDTNRQIVAILANGVHSRPEFGHIET